MNNETRRPVRSIVITFNGETTYATLVTGYSNGCRTKSAKARFSSEDPPGMYSPYEGARIALARLFGVEPFVADDEPQFKEGDIVRITANDARRGLTEGDLGKVIHRAPNKMTPYAVKVLDSDFVRCADLLGEVIAMPGEMRKIEE